jgi:hypothetical protein
LLSAGGIFLLILISGVLALRGVDRVEIIAALLYIPVFLILLAFGLKGGIIAGVAAAATYAGLRFSAVEIVGFDRFIGLIGFRAVAYVAFGAIGGWAAGQLGTPLKKLEQHDLIDDASGLFNARFFVRETAVETARADRYGTEFSVVAFEVPSKNGGRSTDIHELGRLLSRSLRTVDRAVHANTGKGSLFAAILPETPATGADIVAEKIATSMNGALGESASATVQSYSLSYPAEKEAFTELKELFQAVDRKEHPEEESPQTRTVPPGTTGTDPAP